ncbi:hypothetical protein CARUB_v10017539mg [Capsella rubella]|uniref:WAT1-related protein n=1 Tax=Capsella rubella TaxID=81985 RepID=R0H4S9_9BRAS|nr:WAT1-related protein At3g28130 [Capsella rubella]EOA24299.1 hypothetical protein CARUB_v10017539mg [Capsella rubella]
MASVSLHRRDAMLMTAMLATETGNVAMNTLFKAATSKGLSSYTYLIYSYLIGSFVLLVPYIFYYMKSRSLPPLSFSILCKIGVLGLLGSTYLIIGFIGIEYSSPTLASAISNINPAITFILAIIFRMEKASFNERSSVAKIVGTIVSLVGALVVVLYHGHRLFAPSSPSFPQLRQLLPPLASSNSDWIIGGCLLAIKDTLIPVAFILQAHIMKTYPEPVTVSFVYFLIASIFTPLFGIVAEKNNPSLWIIHFDITMVCIVVGGIFNSGYYTIHLWAVCNKGPVYLAIFRPLSILIAVIMGAIFLGDSFYLGSLVGGILISLGFYSVIWGKAEEEKTQFLLLSSEEAHLLIKT